MIPKVIHYCWFGGKPLPPLAISCIKSWHRYLPDYQLRLWDESTFYVNSNPYVNEAYLFGKYAFVTDYVRLYALYHFGGIYMDTDVEVIKNMDELITLPGFTGFESEKDVPTGIMACEPYNEWAKEQLSWYDGKHFFREDGTPDFTSNVEIISVVMAANGFILNNTYQVYRNCMHIFPKDFFCPKSRSGKINITSNTYCIHHFAGSWLSKKYQIKRIFFHRFLGPIITEFLTFTKRKLTQEFQS